MKPDRTSSVSTRRVLRALDQALASDTRKKAERALAPLKTWGYRFDDDTAGVEHFVAAHRNAVERWMRDPHAGLRRAAMWSAGAARDGTLAASLLEAMRENYDDHDLDVANVALRSLGTAALPAIAEALRGDDEALREVAVRALGMLSGCAREALAVLADHVDARGFDRAVGAAIFNLHTSAGVSLALRGCTHDDPGVRMDAVGAVHECLRVAAVEETLATVEGDAVARAVAPLVEGAANYDDGEDPWASTLAWSLDALAWVRAPRGRDVALDALARAQTVAVRLRALLALRPFAKEPAVVAAVTPWLAQRRVGELRGGAALVLMACDDEALAKRARAAAMARLMRPGARDGDWQAIAETVGARGFAAPRLIRAWTREEDVPVRRRLVDALMETVWRAHDGRAALDGLCRQAPANLARTLRRRWALTRGA